MIRENMNGLLAFITIAKELNFTKAAAKLGVSQSALSHTMNELEERLGIRLLTRTTRKVSPTEAGERLLQTIAPHFEEIQHELSALSELRDKPAGTIRITTTEFVINTILWPKLTSFLQQYPDIQVELIIDYSMTDIVEQRFDAGVRIGKHLANGMISVPIGPDMRMAVVGSPAYFAQHKKPMVPQDLTTHCCINLRLQTYGGLYAWEFEKEGQTLSVRVKGQVAFNTSTQMLIAALDGFGLAYIPEEMAKPYIEKGVLIRVLDDWCPPFSGFHLYYPHRRNASPAFTLLVDALRYHG
ncbi:LysR family transcriptional regulator [Neisseria sp. Ec49-e6-T10]|uniref:LysR family transcriptional regulator n=1 Tax=Neisseria sp. Ec49-e6-T10 TaxID=3140744 RepID=UPI003EBCFF1C